MVYLFLKRCLDLALGTATFVLSLPVWFLISLCILLESGRPVFFLQQRVGRKERLFWVLKFRTLKTGPHDPDRPDLHTTRVGEILRRYALDELPQLLNIIRGDMSLVGPRPILPPEAQNYNDWQRTRLRMRPGLTGWAQVNGRNALPWNDRIAHDVWYVEHASLWLDIKILLKTPFSLLMENQVYGPGNRNPDHTDFADRFESTMLPQKDPP